MKKSEALAMFHATSKEAGAAWNTVRAGASKVLSLAIQRDSSVQAMIAADRRYDRAIQKADAIMATTMRQAHERLLEQFKECKE